MRRGLAGTADEARTLIQSGAVLVSGATAANPERLVAAGEAIELLKAASRFVGRGGEKLDGALARFGIDVAGRDAIDVGASTGGFTDCLLQRGARSVVALDVGHGQLDARLRDDPRVRCVERTNIRTVDVDELGGPFAVVVVDLSFISLSTVAPVIAGPLAADGADLVVLVKPQFEATRREASRGRGVIRDPLVWRAALVRACAALGEQAATMMGVMASPLRGAEGNVEFLVHARAHLGAGESSLDLDAIEAAVASATDGA